MVNWDETDGSKLVEISENQYSFYLYTVYLKKTQKK